MHDYQFFINIPNLLLEELHPITLYQVILTNHNWLALWNLISQLQSYWKSDLILQMKSTSKTEPVFL